MNPPNGYYHQWQASQAPNGRRNAGPISGTFSNVPPPNPARPHAQLNGQPYPPLEFPQQQFIAHPQSYPHPPPQAAFTPLIPLDAVADLQLPDIPSFQSATIPESFNDAPLSTSAPVVHEGYIPAPGRNDEDVYPALPGDYGRTLFRDQDFESSDDESDYERDELTFEEQMRQLEDRDNSDIDKDYSEEDAEYDEGDPDEMELGVEFEDEEERAQRKRGKPSDRGSTTTTVTRGGRRGRPRGRGQGGHKGSTSTRGKPRGRGRGRPKGIRHGPRKVADPGEEFKELQRQANERFIAQDYATALDYAQRAIQMNPEIFDAHNIASEIYAAMGEEVKSIDSLIIGAPTKRDPGLWHFIIERVNKLDPEIYPEYTDEAKTALTLSCLQQIVLLETENYEARSHILEIEASLGHVSKCVKLGRKMLKLRKEKGQEEPDTEVLKIMAMMGTSSKKQTKIHLKRLLESFDDAIDFFLGKKPDDSDFDWEMINIYLDLLDRLGQYDTALARLKTLARWKQGRAKETYWDGLDDDREFDIEDGPRRIAVPEFKRKTKSAKHGQTLPLEIRVKLGIFRLRKSADDYQEAMHHLEMLEPDDRSSEALVWDYEDLFRVIADALHATGHDKDAMRFYEPLYNSKSQELSLMSYLGIFTCFKNLGQAEKAAEMIPMLKEWNAETVDDLVKLAVFFENQGMLAEAVQRAEVLYRNKYSHRLRRLGFKAYDELKDAYKAQRKQARGKHSARKNAVKKQRKLTSKATGRGDVDEEDPNDDEVDKELPSLGPLAERPKKGLFRARKTTAKPPKAQSFLPFQPEIAEESVVVSKPTTIEGTGVPLRAIDHRLFRRRLEIIAKDNAEGLQAARAQHRETVASFKRLEEISDAAELGDQAAIREVLSITRELIEEFSTCDLFYASRKEEFVSYFRRTGDHEIWKESALMVLAVVANNMEDGATDPELKERPDHPPRDFWGVDFDKWVDAFGQYAVILAREGDDERCFSTLDIVLQANIIWRSHTWSHQLQICRLVCALAVDDSSQASSAVRWLLKENPFGSELFRLFSCANRLCSLPDGFSSGPTHKVLLRYIKTMDYALLTEEERIWYNFRDRKDGMGGFQNFINSEDVKFVKDHDPALFALFAHVLVSGGSYIAALNYYFRAFAITPDDPVLNLSIGVAYIQHALKRLSENRQYQIQQGLGFITRYYDLRTKDNIAIHCQEAEYNFARIWHGLGLVSLAIPAYERCIAMSDRVKQEAEDQCTDGSWSYEDFKYEAAFAIQSIYAISGNHDGARRVTENVLVLE
ncbi:TPR-like protein [Phaeosphaeriaceae sp. SRC1lsM3a]|nr:TPR-like protein [Stagonospora sp. SRC1lsM3a]